MPEPIKAGNAAAAPKAQELTGKVMNFLSTANGETLGACAVGLGAVTYFVLGRVGLVLMGAAGGVVLHAMWEDQHVSPGPDNPTEIRRRKEVGLDIVQRLLNLERKKSSGTDSQEDVSPKAEAELMLASGKELNFSEFPPDTRSALTALADAVIRDYVKYALSLALSLALH